MFRPYVYIRELVNIFSAKFNPLFTYSGAAARPFRPPPWRKKMRVRALLDGGKKSKGAAGGKKMGVPPF